MIDRLKQEASKHGDKLQVISIERLHNIKNDIEFFKENEELNGFQRWIISDLYKFVVPVEFEIKSILLIAIPHPAYAKVQFIRENKEYNFLSLCRSDFENTKKYLQDFLIPKNYHMAAAPNIPLKRLAAQSGLASYGRNNICYIEGMGSIFSFDAYFSDLACDKDDWTLMQHSKECNNCKICLNNCPTGAIREDRFLIDNERCLSFMNESPDEFPDWLPLSVHHCLYDCLKCQIKCPMNKDYVNNIIGPFQFNEEETEMLLAGKPYDTFSDEMKTKTKLLGMNDWIAAIPRNLKTLIELSESR